MKLPEKLTGMTPYQPTTERYPIRLDANESFLPLPEEKRSALAAAVAEAVAFNRYPDPLARALCAAAADYYGVPETCVTAGNGSDELISVLMNTFLPRGGRVLVTEPDFSMYAFYAGLAEAEVTVLPKREGAFTADELIEKAAEAKPDMVLFSNPCNPTGRGLPRGDVLRVIGEIDALVVVDEAYMEFWDQSVLPEAVGAENAIVLRTCSKALGLAAARVGFAVACGRLTGYLRAAKSPFNVNTLSQIAGELVLRDKAAIRGNIAAILKSRDALTKDLAALAARHPDALEVFPCVTNFVLAKPRDAAAMQQALRERGVCVRLLGDCLRITAGSEEENGTFLRELEILLEKGGD
ncbi:MAG TPA: aminotransferase class I/II-fold pyridoxal phosphate-dependent enzyme [Oscillospiraceae bacterium]|nr:aminotransferase class I/II-fold pyridoxal phosphate-dependent enzyme [Oscillospiraceae bacterium]